MLVNKALTSVAPPLGATVGLVRAGMTQRIPQALALEYCWAYVLYCVEFKLLKANLRCIGLSGMNAISKLLIL